MLTVFSEREALSTQQLLPFVAVSSLPQKSISPLSRPAIQHAICLWTEIHGSREPPHRVKLPTPSDLKLAPVVALPHWKRYVFQTLPLAEADQKHWSRHPDTSKDGSNDSAHWLATTNPILETSARLQHTTRCPSSLHSSPSVTRRTLPFGGYTHSFALSTEQHPE